MNRIVYPNKQIYVSSPIGLKFNTLKDFISQNDAIFILNGGICIGGDEKEIETRILELNSLKEKNAIYYNASPEDLYYMNDLKNNLNFNFVFNWISKQKFVTQIEFSNQTTMLIMAGAIKDQNFKNDVNSCLLNDGEWHQSYNGQFGFVISNMPKLMTPDPAIYNFSCSIGMQDPSKVILQEISGQGLLNFLVF